MADYSLGGGGGYGDGGLGLGSDGGSSGVGLGAPSSGYFGGGGVGGSDSGGNGSGMSANTNDLFSYDPQFSGGYSPTTSYSLGDLYSQDAGTGFNMNGAYGLQMPSNPYGDTGKGFGGQEGEDDWWNSGMGKFVKGVGRFALSTNPVGRLGMIGYDAYDAMKSGNYGQMAGGLIGGLTGNGLLGSAVGIGTDAAMGKPVAGRVGSTLGSVVGGGIAGPLGSMAGGYLGNKAATNTGGYTDRTMSPTQGDAGKGLNFENLASGLGNLYLNNRAAKAADSNVQSLDSMFGQNSAYSQQLRQQLERRDAAGGRRSQYGPREVELQAKLAQMAAQYGPNIAQSNMAAQQASQQKRAQNLSSLYAMGRESGLFGQAQDALSSLFSSNQSRPLYFDNNTSGDVYSV